MTTLAAFDDCLQRAMALHRTAQPDEAARLYCRLLVVFPGHSGLLLLLGAALSVLRQDVDGLRWIGRAGAATPDAPGLAANRANALIRARRRAAALCRDGQVEAGWPPLAAALSQAQGAEVGTLVDDALNHAAHLIENGRAAAAARLCRHLLPYAQGEAALLYHLWGIALRQDGRMDEALLACARAILLQPGLAAAYFNLGNLLVDVHGRRDGGFEAWRRAQILAPHDGRVAATYAHALVGADRKEAAVAAYRRAVALDGQNADLLHSLANLLRDRGHPTEARRLYRRAMLLAPEDGRISLSLIWLLIHINDHDGAVAATRVLLHRAIATSTLSTCALQAVACLVDFSIHAPDVMETAFALARRVWRRHPHDTAAFYTVVHQLYRDGRLRLAGKLAARMLARFTPQAIAADAFLRIWSLCRFDTGFFARLTTAPPPDDQLPPLRWEEPATRFDRPVLFVTCDERYWSIYGSDLVDSLFTHCPDPALHLHLIDPSAATLEQARRECRRRGRRINVTHENTSERMVADFPPADGPERKTYLASVRFPRLATLLRVYTTPVVMLDADCLVEGNLYRFFRTLGQTDAAVIRAPGFGPTREYNARFLYLRPNTATRRLVDLTSRYILDYLRHGQPFWMLDQAALYCCWDHLDRQGLAPSLMSFPDLATLCHYEKASLTPTAGG